jgi:hypothetical protein
MAREESGVTGGIGVENYLKINETRNPRDFKSRMEDEGRGLYAQISKIVTNIDCHLNPSYISATAVTPDNTVISETGETGKEYVKKFTTGQQEERREKLDIAVKFLGSFTSRLDNVGKKRIEGLSDGWLDRIKGQLSGESKTDYPPNPSAVIGLLSVASEAKAIEFLTNSDMQGKYPRIAAEVIKKRDREFANEFLQNHESIKDDTATIEALKKADPDKALGFILSKEGNSLQQTHPEELLKIGNKILNENKGIKGSIVEQWENLKLKLERTFIKTRVQDQVGKMRVKLESKQATLAAPPTVAMARSTSRSI